MVSVNASVEARSALIFLTLYKALNCLIITFVYLPGLIWFKLTNVEIHTFSHSINISHGRRLSSSGSVSL